MSKPNTSVLWSVEQPELKTGANKATNRARVHGNIGLDKLLWDAEATDGEYVKRVIRNANGELEAVKGLTLSSVTNSDKPVSGSAVNTAINGITVYVDGDTDALNRLYVTSDPNHPSLMSSFKSGLVRESRTGHPEETYLKIKHSDSFSLDDTTGVSFGRLLLSPASTTVLGGVKINFTKDDANAQYPVQLDGNHNAYVDVSISNQSTVYSDTSNTIKSWSQTKNGTITITSEPIAIGFNQVTTTSAKVGELATFDYTASGSNKFSLKPSNILIQSKASSSLANHPATNDCLVFAIPEDSVNNKPAYFVDNKIKFDTSKTDYCLGQDGQWHRFNYYTYTLPVATSNALGGIKIGYTQNNQNYPVLLSSEKAYVSVPWTDTKNTVGTGTHMPSSTALTPPKYTIPFFELDENNPTDNQLSYARITDVDSGLNQRPLVFVEETNDSLNYRLTISAKTGNSKYFIPMVSSNAIPGANTLVTYNGTTGVISATGSCGDADTPIYLDNGVPTTGAKLYASGFNYNPGDIYHDPSNTSLYIEDLTDSSTHKPIRFIGSFNYGTWYTFIEGSPAEDDNPAIDDRWVHDTVGGFVFGDGLGSFRNPAVATKYLNAQYDNNNTVSPVFVEAPSILYAMTTTRGQSYQNYDYEVWNKHRLTDYKYVWNMRTSDANSQYISWSTLGGATSSYAPIAMIPPKHWAFISGFIQDDPNGSQSTNMLQSVYFHITKTPAYNSNIIADNSLHAFDYIMGQIGGPARHNFSFFAYNPDPDERQYVVCSLAVGQGFDCKLYKQIIIFKTPEYGGNDFVYDNYPPNWHGLN